MPAPLMEPEAPPMRGPPSKARLLRMLALACAAVTCSGTAVAEPPQRIAVLNWAITQTLLALDKDPVAIADVPGYNKWVGEPALPEGVINVGRRIEPDLDVLAAADPDLIVTSGYTNRGEGVLERIAPTRTYRIYQPERDALPQAFSVTRQLAEELGREPAWERLQARYRRAVDRLAAVVEPGDSVYMIRFRDGAHVQIFGRNSLFQGVLEAADLTNAWAGDTNFWGFSMIPVERLDAPADHLLVLEPIPRRAEAMMRSSPIWQALPAVRDGSVHRLGAIWNFGGVPSAVRFANRFRDALDEPR